MTPRLGLWGARGDRRGLCIQSSEFARHMRPDKVMGFDLRSVGPSRLHCDWDDFRGSELTVAKYNKVTREMAMDWLRDLDVVWGCETFYQDEFPSWARDAGVATIQHVNPEFYRFDLERKLPRPTIELSPSMWRIGEMSGVHEVLECPIALDRLRYRQRPLEAGRLTFLHVVGVAATEDRNGTHAIRDALELVQQPCRLIVRAQRACGLKTEQVGNVEVQLIRTDVPHYWDLYDHGDVLLMPRRYGGQCLPVREAAACGLPSIMTDVSPQEGWGLPGWRVPATETTSLRTHAGHVDVHHPEPEAIAHVMDALSGGNHGFVTAASEGVREWAEARSWQAMRPAYDDVIARAYRLVSGGVEPAQNDS